jgi:hypothetical protein
VPEVAVVKRLGRDDPGQAAIVAVAVALLALVAVGRLAVGAADAARARTAADAAALAGASSGAPAAARAAAANGARLTMYRTAGPVVTVRACVRGACASASARLLVARPPR